MVNEFFFGESRHEMPPEHEAIFRIGLGSFEDPLKLEATESS